MSKKHFKALADVLSEHRPQSSPVLYAQWLQLVKAIAGVCADCNGRFDRQRFYRACGVE